MWNAESIKALRRRARRSQSSLASELGVHRRTIEQWEAGYPAPNEENQQKLSKLANDLVCQ